MFDEFVANVSCPGCKGEDEASVELVMQTHLRASPEGESLRVGHVFDPVDIDPSNIRESGYLLVTSPASPGVIRLADTWYCGTCDAQYWAVVEIVELRLEKIAVTTMDRATLSSVNYIGEISAEGLARSLLGDASPEPIEQLDIVEVLRRHLV